MLSLSRKGRGKAEGSGFDAPIGLVGVFDLLAAMIERAEGVEGDLGFEQAGDQLGPGRGLVGLQQAQGAAEGVPRGGAAGLADQFGRQRVFDRRRHPSRVGMVVQRLQRRRQPRPHAPIALEQGKGQDLFRFSHSFGLQVGDGSMRRCGGTGISWEGGCIRTAIHG